MKPMSLFQSIIFMFAIALIGMLAFYGLRPILENVGLDQYSAYFYSLSAVFLVMIVWTVVAYIREGNERSLKEFSRRMGIDQFRPGLLVWSIAVGLLMLLSTAFFSPITARLATAGLVPIPDRLPDYINPTALQSLASIRDQLASNQAFLLIPIVLLLNVFSEELFWRGLIFPRQELVHGSHTFLVHGLIWAFTHLFQYWLLPPIIVGAVVLSFARQKTKNTWVGIIAHFINNSLPILILLLFIN